MTNVRLRVPPNLVESARAAQYANRERIGVREMEIRLKKKAKRKAEEEVKKEKLDKEKQPDGRRVGGQLEHEKREQYKIWTRRRRGGTGFALIPSAPPDGKYILLETSDDFDASAYGNLGSTEHDPDMTYEPGAVSKPAKLLATKARNVPGGLGPDTYGVFYHIADPSPPLKRTYPFPNPNPPYANSLYETCTFEVILTLGSTPAPSGTVKAHGPIQGGSIGGNGYLGDYFPVLPEANGPIAYIDFYGPDEQPKPIGEMGPIIDVGPTINHYAEMFVLIGGVQLQIVFDSKVDPPRWRLEIFNFDIAEENKILDGDKDYHFSVVYEKDKVTIYLNGEPISTDTESSFTSTRNLSLARTEISVEARKSELVQVLPYNPFTKDRRPVPVYWIRAGYSTPGSPDYRPPVYFLIGFFTLDSEEVQTETTECRSGFHSLRFTPEQALYSENFTPPTQITSLA